MQQASPQERQNLAWRAKPYGKDSAYDTFAEARKYSLEGSPSRSPSAAGHRP